MGSGAVAMGACTCPLSLLLILNFAAHFHLSPSLDVRRLCLSSQVPGLCLKARLNKTPGFPFAHFHLHLSLSLDVGFETHDDEGKQEKYWEENARVSEVLPLLALGHGKGSKYIIWRILAIVFIHHQRGPTVS